MRTDGRTDRHGVILCFVDRASLYNIVNKANLVRRFSYYIITIFMQHLVCKVYTKCCVNTVVSPDDEDIVARNMYRKEINFVLVLLLRR